MARDDLTVPEAAAALGTTPQTVRALLRKGELAGRQEPWGSRYTWVPSRVGVDEFLARHGRLDGHRRRRAPPVAVPAVAVPAVVEPVEPRPPPPSPPPPPEPPEPGPEPPPRVLEPDPHHRRPFVLRPRGRATVVVVLLGVPLVVAYGVSRILPSSLWFDELGQEDVLRRVVAAKVEFYVLVVVTVAIFVRANLRAALRGKGRNPRRAETLAVTAGAIVTGTMFASATQVHWQTYLLWRHRQSFGVTDPLHHRDVGYFVFSLPFELMVSVTLLWLVAVTAGLVALVYAARGALGWRPRHATFAAQMHLAILAALFLLVLAWRFHLRTYTIELDQPSPRGPGSFAGAGYVDVRVGLPGLEVMTFLAVVLALVVLAAPLVARAGSRRATKWFVGVPATMLLVAALLIEALIPALVQRYVVNPSPLLSEQTYLDRSIAATRAGLGLDTMDVQAYSPAAEFTAADFPAVKDRLRNVPIWDSDVLGARMSQLVTETPYYKPEHPTFDVVRVDGRRQPSIVSTRDLDLGSVPSAHGEWTNDRLAFTHGLGLIRFSNMVSDEYGAPRLLDPGVGVRQPRIYFGNLPQPSAETAEEQSSSLNPTASGELAQLPWVLVNTRRPEVDIPAPDGAPRASYHYRGTGGIELSSWIRRAAFALALGSKDLLLSEDITPESRLMIHRDVMDRLHTLAPFIQWDGEAVPLTADGRIVFVVDGYTTSESYPYAERVDLGGTRVNYARASVRATVDAFSGEVNLYLTDPADPIVRAWSEIFPTLFRPEAEFPAELRDRLRYPIDLFNAQATAYEKFHTTRPDLFVSDADAWSRPISLSGSLEVAGDIDFDESDEDDLRRTLPPSYKLAPPPGHTTPRIVIETYYVPHVGQNLVGDLSGWVDDQGELQLGARNLQRQPATLGPAQVSRLVFATARVRNLLGLRNLEIRDIDKSSLSAVLLGQPRMFLLDQGVLQLQSLYEGSRGAGAARLLGVTAFLNGRAGLGPDIESAIRQALNAPPRVAALAPEPPVVVGKPVELTFRVANAKREDVSVEVAGKTQHVTLRVQNGVGTARWTPRAAGEAQLRVQVTGLDGTAASDTATFAVLSAAPTVKFLDKPAQAVVGEPVVVPFAVANALEAGARVSTVSGIEFMRRYLVRDGTAVVEWTPQAPGPAELLVTAEGRQEQVATKRLRFDVLPAPTTPPPPTVSLLQTPTDASVGVPAQIAFDADGCRVAVARIEEPGGGVRYWRFPCPASAATFTWTPSVPGAHRLVVVARGRGIASQTAVLVDVGGP